MDKSGVERGSAFSTASSVSVKTDCSREYPPDLSIESTPSEGRLTEDLELGKCGPEGGTAFSTTSFGSAKTDRSREYPPDLSTETRPSEGRLTEDVEIGKRGAERGTALSTASVGSAKTDRSREYPPDLKTESRPSEGSDQTSSNFQQDSATLKLFESKVTDLVKQALMVHEKVLPTPQQGLSDEDEQENVHKTRNEANEAALKIAVYVLRTMNEKERAHTLEQSHYGELV
ncbi:uncharacterized protein AKAME5_002198200, partial [Lates japonicus]